MEAPPGFFYLKLPLMLRLEGVKGNAKVRLPERGHIETSMLSPHRNTVAFNAKSAGGERQSKLASKLV
jgi:hypothetical protein